MSYAFVYVLNNESMPGIYKIGYTTKSPKQRAVELSSKTSVPLPYEVVCYGELQYASHFEQELHKLYDDKRVNQSREFFELSYVEVWELSLNIKSSCENFTRCQELDIIFNHYLTKEEKNGTN